MKTKTEPTRKVQIYLGGSLITATQTCRKFCLKHRLCVTLEKTLFVYDGGAESGVKVQLVNFPKHPCTQDALETRAERLILKLMDDLVQETALMITATNTDWFHR